MEYDTATEKERRRVFLAHSSGDKPYVREIHHLLRLDGFRPWLDVVDLVAGQTWELEIEKAVQKADVVVLFLSQRGMTEAGYLHKEIAIALEIAQRQPEGTISIVPIRLDECDPPRALKRLQWIDVSKIDCLIFYGKAEYGLTEDWRDKAEGFMIGESYLRLQEALLRREALPFRYSSWDRRPPIGDYLVHGRTARGQSYYGVARIEKKDESFQMVAKIGSETHEYEGTWDGVELQFSGSHEVYYVQSGERGLLIGTWKPGGLEELILSSGIEPIPR